MAFNQGGFTLRPKATFLKDPTSASKGDNGTCVLAPVAEHRGRSRCRCVRGDAGIRRIVSRPYVLGPRCVGVVLFLLLAQHCIVKCAVAAPDPVRAITSARSKAGIAPSSPVVRRLDGRQGGEDDSSDDDDYEEKEPYNADDRLALLESRDLSPSAPLQGLQVPLRGLSLSADFFLGVVVILGGFLFLLLPALGFFPVNGTLRANHTRMHLANSTGGLLANSTGGLPANSTGSPSVGRFAGLREHALVYYVLITFAYALFLLLRGLSSVVTRRHRGPDQSGV